MKSLFQQIQELRHMPHARSFKAPNHRHGSQERAAKWKDLTDALFEIHTRIVHLQLTDGDATTIVVLEAEANGIEMSRNQLKREYWNACEDMVGGVA